MIQTSRHQTFSYLLIVRKSKSKKDKNQETENIQNGKLYVRFTVNRKIKEFATIIKINTDKWDQTSKRVLGRTKEAEEINKKIVALERRIGRAELQLIESDDAITLENFLIYYNNEGFTTHTILGLYDKLIERKKKEENCVK